MRRIGWCLGVLALASFVAAGVTNFIFANQALRTVVTALQHNLRRLAATRDLMSIEREIAPVSEIFRLQNVQELKSSEKLYLPSTSSPIASTPS